MRHLLYRPTLAGGVASGPGEALFPELWDDLAGLWVPSVAKQGGVLHDFSGQGSHVTMVNTDQADYVGDGLDFNGTDEYGEMVDNTRTQVVKLTVMAWVFPRAAGADNNAMPVITRGQTPYSYYLTTGGQKVNMFHVSGSWLIGTNTLPLNEWTHVAGSWDGATRRVWLNGVEDKSVADTVTTTYNTVKQQEIARRADDPGVLFNGIVDDVRLYGRALTQGEMMLCFYGASPLIHARHADAWEAGAVAAFRRMRQVNDILA